MKVKKLVIMSFCVFLLTFCLAISVSAYEYWHKGLQSIPSDIYISTSVSSAANARCRDAMETWNDTCFSYDCLVYSGTTSTTTYAVEDDKNTITIASTTESYLGQTTATQKKYTFLWLNWYMEEFDININPKYSWYTLESETSITSSTYANHYDLESMMLHELGHALGLDHAPDRTYNGARVVMYESMASQQITRALSEDDRRGIVDLY